jgi:hypothetical protein
MPMPPSNLALELPEAPGRPGGYLPTSSALLRIAQAARSRLVVMTPFIDGYGFGWLRTVFDAAPAQAQRILILREVGRYAVDLSVHHAEWLRAHNVSVRDYHLPHSIKNNRMLPIETFHAKIVLADAGLAYVGSGDGTSLEAGTLLDGGAAAQVARLIDGVLRVARHI